MHIQISWSTDFVSERLEDGSSILFDPSADQAHALNAAATRVWEVLVRGGDEMRVRSILAASLGADIDEHAVYNTLAQFQQAGLIRTDADGLLADHASRGDTLRHLGFRAAAAFPLIETLAGSDQLERNASGQPPTAV